MNRVGVIDIGSNAIRFMLTEVEEGGYFRIIDELSTTVRLGYDLIDNDFISDEKIQVKKNFILVTLVLQKVFTLIILF